ncbi:MAG: hypothetical protein NTV44_02840, partial [Firmicutes bacterium]|nr:hypothetical protein [Bacillota bacterium]
ENESMPSFEFFALGIRIILDTMSHRRRRFLIHGCDGKGCLWIDRENIAIIGFIIKSQVVNAIRQDENIRL